MKKILSSQEIIELHIISGEISDIATLNGDYKTNNREGKKLKKLFLILENNLEQAKEVYAYLLDHDNVTVKTEAASACLKLGIFTKKSVELLIEISKRGDIGIRRLNAEMVLRVWRGEFPGKTL